MNAKQEFLAQTKDYGLLCAELKFDHWSNDTPFTANLLLGYTEADYNLFLASIDRNYDDGYGGQELWGTIWHTANTWSSRGEYDGSEWWDYNEIPEIPSYLRK